LGLFEARSDALSIDTDTLTRTDDNRIFTTEQKLQQTDADQLMKQQTSEADLAPDDEREVHNGRELLERNLELQSTIVAWESELRQLTDEKRQLQQQLEKMSAELQLKEMECHQLHVMI